MIDPRVMSLEKGSTHQITTYDPDERNKVIRLPAGARRDVGVATGPGYVAKLWLTFPGWFWAHWEPERPVDQRILKSVIVHITADGAAEPQISAPVSDLFGLGLCQVTNLTGLHLGMSSGGFYLSLPMPFRESLRIEIENVDRELETDVFMNVLYQRVPELAENAPYLHAFFQTGRNPGGEPLRLIDVEGAGSYVGCTLSCQAEDRNYLAYLEAPEHFTLDDEPTPRIIGTGLEDYFLGGWYFREGTFIAPHHGVPIKDALDSSVSMYRFHDLDAVHFDRRLIMTFEHPWAADRLRPFAHSSVAFCYLDQPVAAPRVPDFADLHCWYRIRDTDHQSIP